MSLWKLLHHEAFGGAGTGVQETLMEHVVCFVGEGGKEIGQFLTLPVSFRMTGVGTEDKHSAGQQKILIGSHEQYAYRHYRKYIPEYFDGLFAACEVMKKQGYEPVYFNELV